MAESAPAQPAAKPRMFADYSELVTAFRPSWGALAAVVVFSCLINLLMLTGPLYMLQIYDRVLASGSVPTLIALTALVVVLYGLYGFLEFIRARIMMRVARVGDEALRDRVFDAVSYHAVRRTAGVRAIPLGDLLNIRQFIGGQGPFAFLDVPWAPVYLFVLYLLHPLLCLYSVVAMVILAALMIANDRWTRQPVAAAQKSASAASNLGEESRRQVESATALGMQSILRDRWRSVLNDSLDHQTVAADRGGALSTASKTMRMMFQSGILALGAWLVIEQQITAGTMIAASIIMGRALAPVEQLVAHWQAFLSFQGAAKRLSRVLKETPVATKRMPLPPPVGRLEVDNLVCLVPGAEKPIISGISFDLPPGSGLGIIGPTGAGKSTLARALVGVWPFARGAVRLDGASIEQWDRVQLGKHMGYLPQDVELFEGTIAENIARFEPDADPDQIVKAAQQADVHELILKFPDGYNTMIGEGGGRLSAGQRQRIGLARALYRDPSVIVLDEPNANLDAEGEAALIKAILAIRERKGTVVVVAHRPSAIAALDMLMMIRDGRSVAYGPRDEVLDKVLARRKPATPAPVAGGLALVASEENRP
jgi:PrtD family type I secretion system ABC transporter